MDIGRVFDFSYKKKKKITWHEQKWHVCVRVSFNVHKWASLQLGSKIGGLSITQIGI